MESALVEDKELEEILTEPKEASGSQKKPRRRPEEKSTRPLYHCNYCSKDITGSLRIKCAVCTDFDLCVECFSVGVEISPHKNNHAYQVMDQLTFPIFDEEWGADEELALLEAVEMYGIGNWHECAEHVITKNQYQCEKHYFSTYINVPTYPLPDITKHFDISATPRERKPIDNRDRANKEESNLVGPSTPVANAELAGWMPLRKEFETEYFNDAESLLSDMIINEEDSEVMKEIKVRILEIYHAKLLERYEKRKFVIDNNLIDLKKVQAAERKRPKEDRDLTSNLNVFIQLLPRSEFDELLNGLLEENATRRRIEELKHYRSIGLKTTHEIEQYENDKRKKDDKKGKNNTENVKIRYGKDIKLEKGKKICFFRYFWISML